MKKQKEESPLQSPDVLIALSKFWKNPAYHKKGIFNAELTKLLLKKLNVSEDELKKIEEKTVKHNLETAKAFESQIEKSKIDPEVMIRRMLLTPGGTGPNLAHWEWNEENSIRVPPEGDRLRHHNRHEQGRGTDFVGDTTSWNSSSLPPYEFKFSPDGTSQYEFELPFFISGPYFLVADDGFFNDRYATLGMVIEITIQQESINFTDTGPISQLMKVQGGTYIGVFYEHVTNEAISNHCSFGEIIKFAAPFLHKDLMAVVSVTVRIVSVVKGEGSIVSFNLTQGIGGVFSSDLLVKRGTYT